MKNEIQEGTIHLKGYTKGNVYSIEPPRVIADPEQMFLICEADLTFGDDQSFVIKKKEFMPGTPPLTLYRELTCHGKISNDGQVQYAWPESWWELGETVYDLFASINLHTGYVITGNAIDNNNGIFTGNYDGEHFNAEFVGQAYQEKPGSFPAFQEVVEGPLIFGISFELEVVNP